MAGDSPFSAPVPELLAPAGDWDCAGRPWPREPMPFTSVSIRDSTRGPARQTSRWTPCLNLLAFLHHHRVAGYVTLNTLVFPNELEPLEETVRIVTAAGVDAVLVQDVGAARVMHVSRPTCRFTPPPR